MDQQTGSELGSLAGIGVSAATGNWIGAAIGAVGLGMQLFGGNEQAKASKAIAEASADEAKHERDINNLKQQQMELEGHRSQLQTIRNAQRARALGINSAVQQGSQFGSGLAGGIADVENQGLFNLQGINQGLEIGRGINTQNNLISDDKVKIAQYGGQSAEGAGLASMGGALMKSGPLIGQVSQGFGSKPSNPYYGPLDYNG